MALSALTLGRLEKIIDGFTEYIPDLVKTVRLNSDFKQVFKQENEQDFIIGFTYGGIINRFIAEITMMELGTLSDEELLESYKIIFSRIPQIKFAILNAG
jgi:hypothetical protein